jgi:hypothetical protein
MTSSTSSFSNCVVKAYPTSIRTIGIKFERLKLLLDIEVYRRKRKNKRLRQYQKMTKNTKKLSRVLIVR